MNGCCFAGINLCPFYTVINTAKVYRYVFYSWVQQLWGIVLAKNDQVKTLEANEYVGGLAHFIMDFMPLQSISQGKSHGTLDQNLLMSWGLGVFLWFGICPEYRLEQFQFITGGDLAPWQIENLIIQRAAGIRWMLTTCWRMSLSDSLRRVHTPTKHKCSDKNVQHSSICPPWRQGSIWSSDHVCHCRQFGPKISPQMLETALRLDLDHVMYIREKMFSDANRNFMIHDILWVSYHCSSSILMASLASLVVALVLTTGTAKVPDATCLVQATPQLLNSKIQKVQIDPVPAPDGYELKCSKCICLVPSARSFGLSISQCAQNCEGTFQYTTATSEAMCGCCGNTQVMDEPNDPISVYVPKR